MTRAAQSQHEAPFAAVALYVLTAVAAPLFLLATAFSKALAVYVHADAGGGEGRGGVTGR